MRAVGHLGIAIGAALVALVLVLPAPIPDEVLFLIMAGIECGTTAPLPRVDDDPDPEPVPLRLKPAATRHPRRRG